MKFRSLNDALVVAKRFDRSIYFVLENHSGVFQVWPGGRSIRWPVNEKYLGRMRECAREIEALRRGD